MSINFQKHKMPFLIIGIVVIYALQFLVFPNCLPQYYPVSNEAWCIFIIPLVAFSVLTNIVIDVDIVKWAVVDAIYCVMIVAYNGTGLYGIGRRGVALDGMSPIYSFELALITILIIATVLFVFQLSIRVIRILLIKAKKHTSIHK